jgi:anti-sigma factor ChrR (cupin superfamily)
MSMQDDILAAMQTAEPGYPAETTEWRLSNSCYDGPWHQILLPELWESMN